MRFSSLAVSVKAWIESRIPLATKFQNVHTLFVHLQSPPPYPSQCLRFTNIPSFPQLAYKLHRSLLSAGTSSLCYSSLQFNHGDAPNWHYLEIFATLLEHTSWAYWLHLYLHMISRSDVPQLPILRCDSFLCESIWEINYSFRITFRYHALHCLSPRATLIFLPHSIYCPLWIFSTISYSEPRPDHIYDMLRVE